MKTTSLDAIDYVFQHLKGGTLVSTINGKLYRQSRPVNSKSEDVVINSLPIGNEDLQKGIVNVNIYIPNLELNINNQEDRFQPDFQRMKLLTDFANAELNHVQTNDYTFFIQRVHVIEETELFEHYVNIRLEFYSVNNL